MYLILRICGSTKKPAVHNIYEFSVNRRILSCFFLSLLTRTPDIRLSHHPPPCRDGSLLYPNSRPFPSPGGAYGSGGHGPTRRWNLKKRRIYLKLNIVNSVACLWISLKLHRCISLSLARRFKNKVICTILWWFCRWGAPVILRVMKHSLTQTFTFYFIKSQITTSCCVRNFWDLIASLDCLNGLLRTIFKVIMSFPSANIRTLSIVSLVSLFSLPSSFSRSVDRSLF